MNRNALTFEWAVTWAAILAMLSGIGGCGWFTLTDGTVPSELLAVEDDWQQYRNTSELMADVPSGTVVDNLSGIVGCWATSTTIIDELSKDEEVLAGLTDEDLYQYMQGIYLMDLLRFNSDGSFRWIIFQSAYPQGFVDAVTQADTGFSSILLQSYTGLISSWYTSDKFTITAGTYLVIDAQTIRMTVTSTRDAYITNPPEGATYLQPSPLLMQGMEDTYSYDLVMTLSGDTLKYTYADYLSEDSGNSAAQEDPGEWATTLKRITCPTD